MKKATKRNRGLVAITALLSLAVCAMLPGAAPVQVKSANWINLIDDKEMSKWYGRKGNQKGFGDWVAASEVFLDPDNEKRLGWKPAKDDKSAIAYVNGEKGNTVHLFTKMEHADVEAHVEFMVPKGSNSGVYFMGRYEIQVFDSWGVKKPKYSDCGGIYERWKNNKGYEGHGPRVNASRKPGEWQSFDVIFRAPRFDANGKKTENAKFVKVVHNGKVVHENVEVTGPTRAAAFNDEKPLGPLMVQGDHGPVAYSNIRIRELKEESAWTRLPLYEFGDDREDLLEIEAAVRAASPDQLKQIESKLTGVLESPAATYASKQFVCRVLFRMGTAQSVPALAALLTDEKLSHMARYALERNPAPEAGDALLEALGKVDGKLEIGIINSIAGRGDRRAVPLLAKLAAGDDVAVAKAAIAALGRIGGPTAARALATAGVRDKCQAVWADAYLMCADELLAGGKKADAVAIYRKMLAEEISPPSQIAAIQGLVAAKDRSASADIEKAAESPNAAVRTAAKQALEALRN